MDNHVKAHWNGIYKARDIEKLGWYEEKPMPSLNLLSKCDIAKDDPIVDIGCGATTFIDYLIEEGYRNIAALDISEIAINKLKERLGAEKAASVKFIVDDITQFHQVDQLRNIAVWHDRALLHFLLEECQRQAYLSTLKSAIKEGGYAIIAAFSLKGAERCSGLPVKRYDQDMLAKFLGNDFVLVEHLEYLYHMPSGDTRPFLYTLFRRKKS